MYQKVSALAGAVVLALSLAGCTGEATNAGVAASSSKGATASPGAEVDQEHNDADTEFAQLMIVHHTGAVEMADLAVEKAESEQVRDLAGRISAAQGPEMKQMTSWLQAWGKDTSMAGHGGMGHGGMEMDGMSQEEAMSHLEGLTGAEFDRRFLELMMAHHRGAVEMAGTELKDGANPQALQLAQAIVEDQQAEIAEMEQMLQER